MSIYVTDLAASTTKTCRYCGRKASCSWRNDKARGVKFVACPEHRGKAHSDAIDAGKK